MSSGKAANAQDFVVLPVYRISEHRIPAEFQMYPSCYVMFNIPTKNGASQQEGLSMTASDVVKEILRLIHYLVVLFISLFRLIRPVLAELPKWYWSVHMFLFGLLWWALYTFCQFVSAKIDE